MSEDGPNIWIINHYAGNLDRGMEYRHFFLARWLVLQGFRVHIISASYHHLFTSPPKTRGEVTFEEVDGVTFGWIKTPHYKGNGIDRLFNTLTFTYKLIRRQKQLEEKFGTPDVVIASSPHPFVQLNLERLKKRYGVPTIFEERDLWPQMLIDLGSLKKYNPLSLLFLFLERRAYRKNDRVISLWHSADKYMVEQGLDPSRYIYLPNGIELPPKGEEIERDYDHPLIEEVSRFKEKGAFIVGYGGSHGLANPLDTIIDASAQLQKIGEKDIRFFMVGEGPKKAAMVARAKELGLNNIHFFDYVNKSVIMAFYERIDVCYVGLKDLPLFKYGPTSNKLMDYLAMAKPIIYAINSSFDPVTETGAGIKIDPDKPQALVDAILKLRAAGPERLKEMGGAGRRYAEREFNFEALSGKLAVTLRELVKK